jgi:hypothetical protein
MQECLVLGLVVGHFPKDLKNILDLLPLWRYEEYPSASAFKLEGAIEVHHPMLWPVNWSSNLVFPPLCHNID